MSAHYTGELDLQFLRHGKGEYKYPNSVFRFSGEWKAGTKSGHGVFAVEGGSTFEGKFVNGEIEGRGSKQWADGRRYEGDFSRGEACGEGRFTSPAGESYIGPWVQNKRQGRGQLVLPNGQGTYAGEFYRHRYHGEGELSLTSGFRYFGTFANGLPHGLGAAVYRGGSTFNGPYETGRKNGSAGKYVCGVTGICWVGDWAAGNAVAPPSKWSIEPDSTGETFGAGGGGVDQAKATKPGAKVDKGGGKKGGKASKKDIEEPERGDVDKPVVALFNGDGAVAGLWCRCVRDVQEKNELPPVPPELQEDAEESTRLAKERQRDVVSDESGRTLAVTLHEVAESSPGAVGAPVPFFVRRPNATDVSERIGRFPIDGLVALFQLDGRSYPKGTTSGWEKLVIVPEANSAAHTSVGQAEPDPPAKGSKAPANKSKGGKKGESEQPRPGDGGMDARWQVIRSEVQSNRCLVIGAGQNFSLATPPLFFEPARTEAEGAGERKSSVLGAEANAGNYAGSEATEQRKTEAGCAPGVVQDNNRVMIIDESAIMIARSYPFAVCLDFRIDLVDALLNIEDGQEVTTGESGDVTGGEGSFPAKDTIVVRIVSCGNDVEVSALVRLWAPADVPAVRNEAEHASKRRESEAIGTLASGEASSVGSLSTDVHPKGGTPPSTALLSPPSGDGDAMAPLTPTWYLHALTVRSGRYTGTVPCMDPVESASQQRQDLARAAESPGPARAKPPPSGTYAVCGVAEWHALALVSTKDGSDAPVSLCIDGDVVVLRQDTDDVARAGTEPGESELLANGAVVLGGTGGKWTGLAVKNLALYNQVTGIEQLRATTRVFRSWREEQQGDKAADAQEDERWLEEARKAEEEKREPDERKEWIVGADSAKVLRRETVHGEARIDRIVLPKAAQDGGQWVLRVEDVSHGGDKDEDRSTGRARGLGLAESVASEAVAVASPTEEELKAFLPLPTETVKLERA